MWLVRVRFGGPDVTDPGSTYFTVVVIDLAAVVPPPPNPPPPPAVVVIRRTSWTATKCDERISTLSNRHHNKVCMNSHRLHKWQASTCQVVRLLRLNVC